MRMIEGQIVDSFSSGCHRIDRQPLAYQIEWQSLYHSTITPQLVIADWVRATTVGILSAINEPSGIRSTGRCRLDHFTIAAASLRLGESPAARLLSFAAWALL